MEANKEIFRLGDKVFNIQYGWGVVSDIYSEMIIVKFNGIQYGFLNVNNKTLSFTEYTLDGFSQERPEELPNAGDIVWVRRNEFPSEWKIGHFIEKLDDLYYVACTPNIFGWSHRGDEIRTTNPYNQTKQ